MTKHTMTNGSLLTMLPDEHGGGALISSKHDVVELSAADVAAIRGPGFDVAKLLAWLGEQSYRALTSMESGAYLDVAGHVRGMLRTLGTPHETAPRAKSDVHPLFMTRQTSTGWNTSTRPIVSNGHMTQEDAAAHSWKLADFYIPQSSPGANRGEGSGTPEPGRRPNPPDSLLGVEESGGVIRNPIPMADRDEVGMRDILEWLEFLQEATLSAEDYRAEVDGMMPKVLETLAAFDRVTREAMAEPKPDDIDCGKPVAMGHGNDYQCERASGHKGRCGELWEGQELGERALAAQLERLRTMPSGHVEPELSHCGECDKHTRFGTQQTCMECNAMRLVDAPPEWLCDLEALAPGRIHIGPWVLNKVEEAQSWHAWATGHVGPNNRGDVLRKVLDGNLRELDAALERISKLESDLRCMTHDRDQWAKGEHARDALADLAGPVPDVQIAVGPEAVDEVLSYEAGRSAMAREAVAFLKAATHEEDAADTWAKDALVRAGAVQP